MEQFRRWVFHLGCVSFAHRTFQVTACMRSSSLTLQWSTVNIHGYVRCVWLQQRSLTCVQSDTMASSHTAPSSEATSSFFMTESIMGTIQPSGNVHHNLPAATLHQMALEHDKGCATSSTGALIAFSGTSSTQMFLLDSMQHDLRALKPFLCKGNRTSVRYVVASRKDMLPT